MSEEKIVNQDAKKPTETSSIEKTATDNQVEKKTDNFIPQARFDEIIAKLKKAELMNAQHDDANKKRELTDMEKRGEHEAVIEKLKKENDSLNTYKTEQDSITKQRIDSKLMQLPEDKREKWAEASEELIDEALDIYNKGKGIKVSNANPLRQLEGVKDKSDIWNMDKKERSKNWSSIVESFKNKN